MLAVMVAGCEAVRSSRHLTTLLHALLASGNLLNKGTQFGDAKGTVLILLVKAARPLRTLCPHKCIQFGCPFTQ